jgi:hypothetical protein
MKRGKRGNLEDMGGCLAGGRHVGASHGGDSGHEEKVAKAEEDLFGHFSDKLAMRNFEIFLAYRVHEREN